MPTKPWGTLHRLDLAQEYLVLLTELPLKRWRDLGFGINWLKAIGALASCSSATPHRNVALTVFLPGG